MSPVKRPSHGKRQRIVTEDTSTVRALLEGEERYRLLVEHAPLGILTSDRAGNILSINQKVLDLMGSVSPEFTRSVNLLTFPPLIKAGIAGDVAACLATGKPVANECYYVSHWEKKTYLHYNLAPIRDASGDIVGMQAFLEDVTGGKLAAEALRESEEKFRALAETTPAGIVLYRGERFIYVNPVLEEISGYTSEEVLSMNFWDLVHPDDRDTVRDRGLARQRGQPVPSRYEARILARDGKEKWLEFSAGLINYAGEPTGIATLYDITERKMVEEALAEAKATAELYLDLMGHDINNMNQISLGFMEMARHKMEFEGKLTMDDVYLVDRAIESVRNSSNLIRNVRKLQQAKLGIYGPEVMDLGKMLIEVAAQHEDIPGRQVSIKCVARTGCYVMANELLQDVFINLAGNAIKHSRGPLDINIQMNETQVDGQAWWKVIVEDDGPGIPDSQKQTLFDRLNLSVSRARGKGFGLCLIKLLIDGYRGDFRVEDRVAGDYSKGARFVVTLPAVTPGKP